MIIIQGLKSNKLVLQGYSLRVAVVWLILQGSLMGRLVIVDPMPPLIVAAVEENKTIEAEAQETDIAASVESKLIAAFAEDRLIAAKVLR